MHAEKARNPSRSISLMCRVLGVSRSGFYDWRRRLAGSPSPRAAEEHALLEQITALHTQYGAYGSPRIHQELLRAGARAGRHRVARLMRDNGIVAVRGKRKSRPRAAPPVRRPEIKDLVHRIFDRPRPDMLWFTDLTMIKTGEGYLRAAVIMDACSRRVISWATADHETPETAYRALRDAIALRKPPPRCIIHSDRGYQGGFNRSSQHLDHGGLRWGVVGSRCRRHRWVRGGSGQRIGRCGHRCVHRGGRSRLGRCSGIFGGRSRWV
jgi:hypothetical protein